MPELYIFTGIIPAVNPPIYYSCKYFLTPHGKVNSGESLHLGSRRKPWWVWQPPPTLQLQFYHGREWWPTVGITQCITLHHTVCGTEATIALCAVLQVVPTALHWSVQPGVLIACCRTELCWARGRVLGLGSAGLRAHRPHILQNVGEKALVCALAIHC